MPNHLFKFVGFRFILLGHFQRGSEVLQYVGNLIPVSNDVSQHVYDAVYGLQLRHKLLLRRKGSKITSYRQLNNLNVYVVGINHIQLCVIHPQYSESDRYRYLKVVTLFQHAFAVRATFVLQTSVMLPHRLQLLRQRNSFSEVFFTFHCQFLLLLDQFVIDS